MDELKKNLKNTLKIMHQNNQIFTVSQIVPVNILNGELEIQNQIQIKNLSHVQKYLDKLIDNENWKLDSKQDLNPQITQKITQLAHQDQLLNKDLGFHSIDTKIDFKPNNHANIKTQQPELIEPRQTKALQKAAKALSKNPERFTINQLVYVPILHANLFVQTPVQIKPETQFVRFVTERYQDLHCQYYIEEAQSDLIDSLVSEINELGIKAGLFDRQITGLNPVDEQPLTHVQIQNYSN